MEIKGKDVVRQVSMLAGHIADMRGASYEDYERTVSALWDDPPLAAFLLRQSVGDFARGVSAVTAYAVEGLEAVDEESEDLGREALENCRLRLEIDARRLGVTLSAEALKGEIETYLVARTVVLWLGLSGNVYGEGAETLAREIVERLEQNEPPASHPRRRRHLPPF